MVQRGEFLQVHQATCCILSRNRIKTSGLNLFERPYWQMSAEAAHP